MNSRKIIAAAGIAGALVFTSACSAPEASAPTVTSSPSASASPAATPAPSADPAVPVAATAAPVATADAAGIVHPVPSSKGVIPKGVANNGTGDYLQTTITDTDPAMQYDPAIADDAAKAHYSPAQLADAQKVIVKFIAEETIDSTLNGGTDVDGWFAAHKDQIYPTNVDILRTDLKDGKDGVTREGWMLTDDKVKSGYTYINDAKNTRVTERGITPTALTYTDSNGLQGLWLDATASWIMAVNNGHSKSLQSTTAELAYAVVIDPADGKWKIAGYDNKIHTREG